MAKDLYEILGVEKGATDAQIKSAYRKLALQWHPDKHKGEKDAETKFKEINMAYEVLSDKQKRQQYDTFGTQGGPGGGGPGGAGFGGFDFSGFDFGGGGGAGNFADIFESFFGGGGGQRSRQKKGGAMRGNDIEAAINISFEEAVFGCEKELEITKSDVCKACEGKGAEPGSPIVTCKTCSGSGEVRSVRNTILGQIATSRSCDICHGEGRIPEVLCKTCNGSTRQRVKERIKIKIPAGVDNGSVIRLSGKGEGGIKGGSSGDLYINLNVSASEKFYRAGFDIHSEVEIHLLQAVLGTEMDVETVHGNATIKIPAGTEDGKVFKISHKGVPRAGGNGGDHLVKLRIHIPKKLSKKEKELYSQLAEETGVDVKKGGRFW